MSFQLQFKLRFISPHIESAHISPCLPLSIFLSLSLSLCVAGRQRDECLTFDLQLQGTAGSGGSGGSGDAGSDYICQWLPSATVLYAMHKLPLASASPDSQAGN